MLTWQQWNAKSVASTIAARHSLAAGDLAAAVSRAYFAAFQAITGTLIKLGYQPNEETGNWGHQGTQKQFLLLVRMSRSRRERLRRALQSFRRLYRARPIADYGDDSIITVDIAKSLIREAGQIVSLIQRMMEE